MLLGDWRCQQCDVDIKDPASLWRDDEGYMWHSVGDVLCGSARLPGYELCYACRQLNLNLRKVGRGIHL